MSSHLQSNQLCSSRMLSSTKQFDNPSCVCFSSFCCFFESIWLSDSSVKGDGLEGRIGGGLGKRLKSGGWKNCQIREREFRGIERRKMRAAGRIDREEGSHLYLSRIGSVHLNRDWAIASQLYAVCNVWECCQSDWLSFQRQFESRLAALEAFGHVFIGIVDISQSSEEMRGQREGKRAAEALLCHTHTHTHVHSASTTPLLFSPLNLPLSQYHISTNNHSMCPRLYSSPSTFVFFTSPQT